MEEFEFISKIKPKRKHHRTVKVGIGDDAAVYEPNKAMNQVVCVDTMVEDVHFLKEKSSPRDIGYKALAVNISDIAAMGAMPLYYLVSIAIPNSWNEEELFEIFAGMEELATQYQMDLLGGDTVATGNKLVITVTVIGEVEANVSLLRSKAKDGDVVFVTGTLGDSSAGLALLLDNISIDNTYIRDTLLMRHKRPVPQVRAGRLLAKLDRASLNDISDGLASELHEIAEASQVGIVLNRIDVPISSELESVADKFDITKWVLYGGEDYQLVGTISLESWDELIRLCNDSNIKMTKIGYVDKNLRGVFSKKDDQLIPINKLGFNHFR
ncbi:thiamine-phosphate kinase [Metabacillus malikii]|uniref:Thiamine-monophosphate kinase n=1 Tax=Metabacillus malikii TaxID=1504265 RepID=A0ABT9ZMU0_9BACI|nr:thiamine-phosphate kinase [Metabacillus malikii]MDQ0232848.1 thiamine-monophosphate kinase [Metabacillus malikii]